MTDVAVACIINTDGCVLITQRPSHATHGGYWEFPGGKIETGETAVEALKREICEEVGLHIFDPVFLNLVEYAYSSAENFKKDIKLFVYFVEQFKGTATCLEAQLDLKWVEIKELQHYQFPKANVEIIALLKKHLNSI